MYSAWMIESGSERPFYCPKATWAEVQALLSSGQAERIIVGFKSDKQTLQAEWFYRVHKASKLVVDEHSGPHLLLAEDDTSQAF